MEESYGVSEHIPKSAEKLHTEYLGDDLPPIKPQRAPKYSILKVGDWEFLISKEHMLSGQELDKLQEVINIQRLPDMLFGYNRLIMIKKSQDFVFEVSPIDALNMTSYLEREKHLLRDNQAKIEITEKKEIEIQQIAEAIESTAMPLTASTQLKEIYDYNQKFVHNSINIIPHEVTVKAAIYWKQKDVTTIKDFKHLEVISDWTLSTPYKGTVRYLSDYKLSTYRHEAEDIKSSQIKIKQTEEEIPVERLGPENPIVHYFEVPLYEDELDDCGQTSSNVRFRIMKDCWYALIRSYLRVDNVIVRIFDTRVFHDMATNEILREFQFKESTYDELRARGFKIGSDWSISHTQSDEVFKDLELKFRYKDKIIF